MEKEKRVRWKIRLAYILLIFALLDTSIFGLGSVYLLKNGYLTGNRTESVADEAAFKREMIAKCVMAVYSQTSFSETMNYASGMDVLISFYSNSSGRRVGGNLPVEKEEDAYEYVFENKDIDWVDARFASGYNLSGYKLKLLPGENAKLLPKDRIYQDIVYYSITHKYLVTGLCLLGVLLSLLLIGYIVINGWKKRGETVKGIWRWPIETVLIGFGLVGWLSLLILKSQTVSVGTQVLYYWHKICILVLLSVFAGIYLIIKLFQKKWYRNALLYKAGAACMRALKKIHTLISDNMPLIWKMVILLTIVTVVELVVLWNFAPIQIQIAQYKKADADSNFIYRTYYEFVRKGSLDWGHIFIWCLWGLEKVISIPYVIHFLLSYKRLHAGVSGIAEGNLQQKIELKHMPELLQNLGKEVNGISDSFSVAVNERMKSEHFKTELITNVSHDIKTPLTSIINFADLISKEETENDKITEYAEHLYDQSIKMKKLLENLLEATKAANGNVEVHLTECDVRVLLGQCLGEYEERLEKQNLILVLKQTEEEMQILADTKHLSRVFDNLMVNICKYAQENTRVYLTTEKKDNKAIITFKNISKYPLDMEAETLMERFVRGDMSRHTEGQGLGLAIIKSLMDLQGGDFQLAVDGDLFKAILEFPVIEKI